MEITTLLFIVFVAVCFFLYYIVPKKYQWIVLLIASLVFFVSSSAWLTLLMIATTIIIYCGALTIQKHKDMFVAKKKELSREKKKTLKEKLKKRQKIILTIIVLIVIAGLAFTKYLNFLGGIVNTVIGIFIKYNLIPQFNILLPLGISYYTLMSISYIVDVYRGVICAEKNPFRLLLFVCYFPHIIEGPIDRYKELNVQFRSPHKFNYNAFRSGMLLVMYGFFKKLVLADRIGQIVPNIFNNIDTYSGTAVIMGTLLYTAQLYADFSGCIDIVSGVSEMFGIRLAENFRQPFFSKTINEFWRRWHISLGAWLKDYVFYPVSLSKNLKRINTKVAKKIKNKKIANFIPVAYSLFFVWFCNGLWHGASIKYIVYGLYYYFLMMIGYFCEPIFDNFFKKANINRESKIFGFFQMLRTFVIVNIGMLLFRCATLTEFISLIKKMCTSFNFYDTVSYASSKSDLLIVSLCLLIMLIIGIIKEKGFDIRMWLVEHNFVIRWIVYFALIFSTMIMGAYGVGYGEGAAIYAQF